MIRLKTLVFFLMPLLALAQIKEDSTDVFEIFDVTSKAEFPGGEEGLQMYLAQNTVYPSKALEEDAQGTVMVMFIVNKSGRVVNVQVLNAGNCHKSLEKEAMRVVQSTSGMWTPAIQKEEPVNMRYRIPVKFTIFSSEELKTPANKKRRRRLFGR